MSVRRPTGRLLRKLLVGTLVPTTAALVLFGWLAHEVARRSLEEDLGKRLGTAAAAVAMLVLPEQLAAIGAGEEGSNTYGYFRRRLEEAKGALGVRRVLLVRRDLRALYDTAGLVALGAPAHELGADRLELERASAGTATASPLFQGRDGRLYKRAYARVADAGFVVVEGSAEYFASLAAFRRWLVSAGAVGLALIVLFTVAIAHRITGPLRHLSSEAERIGRGELDAPVAVTTGDELGFLAARLEEMRAALRARDERLQMMLAGIAHEVRNPLGGLQLYAGLLREGLAGEPERLGEVARIEREVKYLEAVVSEFLDYARRPKPERSPTPVRPLLTEVAEVCGAGPPHGTRVCVDAADDLKASIDRTQLRRALVNLARNGLAAAGPQGTVVLAARREGQGRVAWEVRDSGAGVPEAVRDKIFTPFFTTREKGTGLGLAFVRDIVTDHGGDITVDGAPEGGARFRFTT